MVRPKFNVGQLVFIYLLDKYARPTYITEIVIRDNLESPIYHLLDYPQDYKESELFENVDESEIAPWKK